MLNVLLFPVLAFMSAGPASIRAGDRGGHVYPATNGSSAFPDKALAAPSPERWMRRGRWVPIARAIGQVTSGLFSTASL
jgi:hypothetical protein